MLGIREPHLYGSATYAALEAHISAEARRLGLAVEQHQSNHEGALVDLIQGALGKFDAIIINAAAYTHTSVAILDALKAVALPVIEVHLTEPKAREDFRKVSYVGMVAARTFSGQGFASYTAALEYLKG